MNKMVPIHTYAKGNVTPEERFCTETFFCDATYYLPFISSKAKQVLEMQTLELEQESLNQNPNILPITHYVQQATIARERNNDQQMTQKENHVRSLKRDEERRAGFINASILLYAILNIGIIIAVTLIIL